LTQSSPNSSILSRTQTSTGNYSFEKARVSTSSGPRRYMSKWRRIRSSSEQEEDMFKSKNSWISTPSEKWKASKEVILSKLLPKIKQSKGKSIQWSVSTKSSLTPSARFRKKMAPNWIRQKIEIFKIKTK
jgi:hypothetical protein